MHQDLQVARTVEFSEKLLDKWRGQSVPVEKPPGDTRHAETGRVDIAVKSHAVC